MALGVGLRVRRAGARGLCMGRDWVLDSQARGMRDDPTFAGSSIYVWRDHDAGVQRPGHGRVNNTETKLRSVDLTHGQGRKQRGCK